MALVNKSLHDDRGESPLEPERPVSLVLKVDYRVQSQAALFAGQATTAGT